MKVRLLTVQEKDDLVGQTYTPSSYFNPIQDCNDNWIISNEEVSGCVNPDFYWVKDLPEIDYCPKPVPPITGNTEGFLGS